MTEQTKLILSDARRATLTYLRANVERHPGWGGDERLNKQSNKIKE